MRSVVTLLGIGIMLAAVFVSDGAAQGVEINPYFGGVFPDSSSIGELKTNALWGVRAGFHLDPSLALEANVGYLNHFEVKGTDPKSRGWLYEFGPTYTFSSEDWSVPKSFTPHLSAGFGAVTTSVKDPSRFSYPIFGQVQTLNGPTLTTVRQIEVSSGDTFFTMSGGGGFKINPGPVGLRADIRARILPNYYRASPVWLEATVGVSFVIGRH